MATKDISNSGTVATDDIKYEALSRFFNDSTGFDVVPTSGGVNNVVQYVTTNTGEKYVLRIYNNGGNSRRVKYEHEVLDNLKNAKLSFKIPTFIPSLSGATHVKLSTGAEACLGNLIPGALPKTRSVTEIGRACGELCNVMNKVDITALSSCPTPPYYDIFAVHHAVNRESFFKEMKTPQFDGVREWAEVLCGEILDIENKIASFHTLNLPKQLIHGDLHYDNVLCDDSGVTGLLDFEFCSIDWRAMELSICLSKYAGEADALSLFDDFVKGFSLHSTLTKQEAEVIPELIILRVLSNVVYFVGRSLGKEDKMDSLINRAETYSNRVRWIRSNRDKIVDMIKKNMSI